MTHLRDLTELEVLELFACAKEIAKKFEDVFKVRSFSYILEDGEFSKKEKQGSILG